MNQSAGSNNKLDLSFGKDSIHLPLYKLTYHWFSQSAYGAVLTDSKGRIIRANPAFCRLLGYEETDLQQLSLPDLIHQDELLPHEQLISQLAAGTIPALQMERRFIQSSGVPLWCEVHVELLRDEQGEPCCLLLQTQNIDDKKQLEAQLKASDFPGAGLTDEREQESAHCLETKLSAAILEQTPEAVALLDLSCRIIQLNPAFTELLGFEEEELLGKQPPIPEALALEAAALFQKAAEEQPVIGYETKLVSKQNRKLDVSLTIFPLRGAHHSIIALCVMIRDISERKQAEEQLRLSDKLAAAGQLAAGVAREICNPLTVVKGFIQFMQQGGPIKDKYLKIMMKELLQVEQVVGDLMALTQTEAVTLKRRQIEPLLREVISMLRSQANQSGVQMILYIHSSLPPVYCEEMQLKQVFISLLRNGIESMPDGGFVHIHARKTALGMLSIVFQDQGADSPDERLSEPGEPLSTTGLGLMICQKILDGHKGSLHFNRQSGHGTTATILLPEAAGPA